MRVWLLVVLVSAPFVGEALCGMCPDGPEFYLECLEGKRPDDAACRSMSICLECLGVPMKFQQRWGNAAERKHLFAMRELPYRDRLVAVAQLYLTDLSAKQSAVDVLAFQGIREIDDIDIFEEVTTYRRPVYTLWYTLAALQDPRTIAFAETRYSSMRVSADSLTDKKRSSLMEIIDCLFHYRTEESRELLKRLADNETDEELKEYIVRTAGV